MEPSYRIFLGRVIELMDSQKDFSIKLGISNQSYFTEQQEDRLKKEQIEN